MCVCTGAWATGSTTELSLSHEALGVGGLQALPPQQALRKEPGQGSMMAKQCRGSQRGSRAGCRALPPVVWVPAEVAHSSGSSQARGREAGSSGGVCAARRALERLCLVEGYCILMISKGTF